MSERIPTVETTATVCPECGTRTPAGHHDGERCDGLVLEVDGTLTCIECGVGIKRSTACPQCGTTLDTGTTPAIVSLRDQVASTDIEASLTRRLRSSTATSVENDEMLSAIARSHADRTVESDYFDSESQVPSLSEELDRESLATGGYQLSTVEGYPTGRTSDAIANELYDEFLSDFLARQTEFTHIGVGARWNPRGGVHASVIAAKRLAQLPGDITPSRLEREIHTATNNRRREHGCSRLSYDTHLASIAANHSRAMASEHFFAHEAPDGTTTANRYQEVDYSGNRAGENIAKQYATTTGDAESVAADVVDGWMDSRGHRENILEGGFTNEGIGVFQASDGALLVTQNFS
ncbi:CAP domain-containing protein [Halosimplex halobium]|uniref:CAP domain-containing protein n=1 Tax=Halosimplex halobium TaxID=3396618 RepID=UPI003F56ED35